MSEPKETTNLDRFDPLRHGLFTHARPRYTRRPPTYRTVTLSVVGTVVLIGGFSYQVVADRPHAGPLGLNDGGQGEPDPGHRPIQPGVQLFEDMETGVRHLSGRTTGTDAMDAVVVNDDVVARPWSAEQHLELGRRLLAFPERRLEARGHLNMATLHTGPAAVAAHQELAELAIHHGDHTAAGEHLAVMAAESGCWADIAVQLAGQQVLADFTTYRRVFERAMAAAAGTSRHDVYAALLGRAYIVANAAATGMTYVEQGLSSPDPGARQAAVDGLGVLVDAAERWSAHGGQVSQREIDVIDQIYRRHPENSALLALRQRLEALDERGADSRIDQSMLRVRHLVGSPWDSDWRELMALVPRICERRRGALAVAELALDPDTDFDLDSEPERRRFIVDAAAAALPDRAADLQQRFQVLVPVVEELKQAGSRPVDDPLTQLRGQAAVYQLPHLND